MSSSDASSSCVDLPPELEQWLARCMADPDAPRTGEFEELCARHPAWAPLLSRGLEELVSAGILGGSPAAGSPAGDADQVPGQLGEFRLLERLGGGGMGVVYRARQESLGREVALKIIRFDQLYFPSARVRFRREAETIARLQHPAIVPVFAVGEHGGIPYFAMELVAGCTLAQVLSSCRERSPAMLVSADLTPAVADGQPEDAPCRLPRSASDRTWSDACAHLTLQVAEALVCAHGHGVLHRDVKPSNIMITPRQQGLLMDFGLASTRERDGLTQAGTPLGSLPYMAPEQLDGATDSIDERSDVYSLGVTLYECLTLQAPFLGKNAAQIRANIERGPPAIRRRNPAVSRDLETVCLRALDPEADQRYASVAAFADDLRRVLTQHPIGARRPTLWRRCWLWTRRRPTLAVGLVMGAVLLVGAGAVALELQRVKAVLHAEEQRELERAANVAGQLEQLSGDTAGRGLRAGGGDSPEQIAGRLEQLLRASRAPRAREVGLRGLLERSTRLADDLGDHPLERARLLTAIGGCLTELADRRCIPMLEEAVAIRRGILPPGDAALARSLDVLGTACIRMERPADAARYYREALAIRKTSFGERHAAVALSQNNLATCLDDLGELAEAERLLRRSRKIVVSLLGENAPQLAMVERNLGAMLERRGALPAAEVRYRRALEIHVSCGSEEHLSAARTRDGLARVLRATGRFEEAELELRKALRVFRSNPLTRAPHPDVAQTLNHLAIVVLTGRWDWEAAQPLFDEALHILLQSVGEDDPRVAECRANLGGLLGAIGAFERGRETIEQVVDKLQEHHGATHLRLASPLTNLGVIHFRLGNLTRARELYDRVAAIVDAAGPAGRVKSARLSRRIGQLLQVQGVPDGAQRHLERALDELERTIGTDASETAATRTDLAALLLDQGEVEAARREAAAALAALRRRVPPLHPWVATAHRVVSAIHLRAGDAGRAARSARTALQLAEQALPRDHPSQALARGALGEAMAASGRGEEARDLLERSCSDLLRQFGHYLVREARARLARAR